MSDFDRSPSPQASAVRNIVLIGTMGAGKTAVGRELARILGFGFVDIDAEVERKLGKSIAEIFEGDGEKIFRDAERTSVSRWSQARSHVVSVGGGAVADDESWRALQAMGFVVWVAPPIEEISSRLLRHPDEIRKRPFIQDLAGETLGREERYKKLMERLVALQGMRIARYKQAQLIVEGGYETPAIAAGQIAKQLELDGILKRSSSALNRWNQ